MVKSKLKLKTKSKPKPKLKSKQSEIKRKSRITTKDISAALDKKELSRKTKNLLKSDNFRDVKRSILYGLGVAGVLTIAFTAPGAVLIFRDMVGGRKNYVFGPPDPKEKAKLKEALHKLKRQRLVEITRMEGTEVELKITQKGKEKLLRFELEKLKISKPGKWDGKWRIVIFDIPEKKKVAREALREKLKDLGFVRLQNSVFIHPYECEDEIDFIKKIFAISPFVKYLVAESFQGDFYLRKYFFKI